MKSSRAGAICWQPGGPQVDVSRPTGGPRPWFAFVAAALPVSMAFHQP